MERSTGVPEIIIMIIQKSEETLKMKRTLCHQLTCYYLRRPFFDTD